MKDPEFGDTRRETTLRRKTKGAFTVTNAIAGIVTALCLATFIFGIGLLISHCEHLFNSQRGIAVADKAFDEASHELNRRSEACNDTEVIVDSSAEAVTAASTSRLSVTHFLTDGSIAFVTQSGESSDEGAVVSIPISTQTAFSTIYSIVSPPQSTTVTKTTTMATSVTLASMEPVCSAWSTTLTVTVTVVPTPSGPDPWASSSVLGDATVIGDASTVTNINTAVSYTRGLPDITVSGQPSTLTDVQTQVSFTSDLPDVTVSGNPATVTDVQTQTNGLPDATVSGNPSTVTNIQTSTSLTANLATSIVTVVISDLWGTSENTPVPTLVTVTAISTVKTTVTTVNTSPIVVTITDAYPVPSPSSTIVSVDSSANGEAATSTQSTVTEFVTTTNGAAVTSTTIIFIPSSFYSGGNSTISGIPAGTATSISIPTTPVIVSGGSKKPEPHAWVFGPGNFGCIIMLIAGVMFML